MKPISIKCNDAIRNFIGKMGLKNGTGFECSHGGKHEKFKLIINNVEHFIHTQFSRSPKEYVHPSVPDQLKITETQLKAIVKCDIDLIKYLRILGLM